MYSKLQKLILPLVLGMLVVTACSNKDSQNNHPLNMLRQDVGSEPPTLDLTKVEDTSSSRIMNDLFAGLLDYDQENNIIPGMASSWELSPDGKTYTFHLRHDLKFSDGSAITAKDFVYSWRRLVDPKTASPYDSYLASIVNAKQIIQNKASPKTLGVEAKDSYTFVVNLEQPNASFLKLLLLNVTFVISQKNIEKYGLAWTEPANMVTSGPYQLKEHVVNGYILAVKNPYYYDESNVSIEQVKYLPYEDKNTTIPSYKSGGLDISFQAIPVDQYAELKKQFGNQLHTVTQEALYYYDFNMKNPVFANNIKLRQALSMAVDREVLTRDVLKQGQKPLYSMSTATVDNGVYAGLQYDWASLPRDEQVRRAQLLYHAAGYSKSHPLEISLSYNTNDLHKRVALAVSAMWQDVFGDEIKVKLQNQEWKTFIQSRHKGNYEIARDGWVADYNGITSYTMLYAHNSGQNNSHYYNPKYDALLQQAILEIDPNKQVELFKQALTVPLNDYPTIPLFQYTYQQLVKPYIKNYYPDKNYLEHMQSKWMSIAK
jgi:oligopeptide transport system substrate-binding protein